MDQYLKAIELYKDIFKDSDVLSKYVFFNEKNIITYAVEIENDIVVACGFCRKKKIRFGDSVKTIPYIFGIATHPNYRHKGYASKIIVKLLLELKEKGYAFAMLTPANSGLYAFYYQFGFVKFNYVKKIALKDLVENDDVFVFADRDDRLITDLFNNANNDYDICQYREIDNTKMRIEEILIDNGKLIYIKHDDKIVGYILLDDSKNICEFIRSSNGFGNKKLNNELIIDSNNLDCEKMVNMSYLISNNVEIVPKEVIRIIDPNKIINELKINNIEVELKKEEKICDNVLEEKNVNISGTSIQDFSENLFNINNNGIKRAFYEEW